MTTPLSRRFARLFIPAVIAWTWIASLASAAPPCLQARVTASDGSVFDNFGFGVAAGGGNVLAGAIWNDDLGLDSGSAYLFHRQGFAWVQTQNLLTSDGHAGDNIGQSMAVSGQRLLIGAPGHVHTPATGGAAYVFRLDDSQWIQEQELRASDGVSQDVFGRAVALSGDVAIIGAPMHDALGPTSGAAYIFRYNPGTAWVQEQKLLASDGQPGDGFGVSVAVQGDLALIGAGGDDDVAMGAGSAYIFRFNPTTSQWIQEQKLLPDLVGLGGGAFGLSVSLGGGVAVVGAPAQGLGGFQNGAVHFFQHDGTQWVRTQKIVFPNSWTRSFGNAVSVDGGFVAIGASSSSPYGPPDHGAAYIYRYNGKEWTPHGPPLLPPPPPAVGGPFFGFSVGLSGATAVVGAYGENGQRGAAYIYNVDPAPADLNCDSVINTLDLGIVLSNWSIPPSGPGCAGDTPCLADINQDGLVNTLDLGMLLSSWTLK